MPLYEFQCPDCGARYERLVRTATAPESIACPSCRSTRVERQFSTFASVGNSSCAPQPGSG